MHVVIFEAQPHSDRWDDYLGIAAALFEDLHQIEGFISIERFGSLSEKGKVLSLSFWENEEAVRRWRTQQKHRHAQTLGRAEIFKDYRLRVASVDRDYGKYDRAEVPDQFHAQGEPS